MSLNDYDRGLETGAVISIIKKKKIRENNAYAMTIDRLRSKMRNKEMGTIVYNQLPILTTLFGAEKIQASNLTLKSFPIWVTS